MTKIITCSELRYRTLAELEALFRTLQIELGRTAPGSRERTDVLASLYSVRRAIAARASTGSRNRERRCFGLVFRRRCARSGLKHDVFEFLAAREAVEIGGHYTPTPIGGRLAAARTVGRDQHILQFVK